MSKKTVLKCWAFFQIFTGCASLNGKELKMMHGGILEFVSIQAAQPTVVFESGLDGHQEWWAKVIPEIAKTNSIFAYNRPGIGKSEKVNGPRDAEHIVEDLRATLKELKIKPPYVLVGHSSGGLYMQLFARKHPTDVVGLVLVDSTHPLQMKGAGARENWPWTVRYYMKLFLSETGERELKEIDRSGEQVLSYSIANLNFPIRILTASDPEVGSSDYERDLIEKRKNLVQLYPNSKQTIVKGGHSIPLENPQVIISAIQDILSQSRK
jgi:pimeloyl-ACP methyl ester carboxylesterase